MLENMTEFTSSKWTIPDLIENSLAYFLIDNDCEITPYLQVKNGIKLFLNGEEVQDIKNYNDTIKIILPNSREMIVEMDSKIFDIEIINEAGRNKLIENGVIL